MKLIKKYDNLISPVDFDFCYTKLQFIYPIAMNLEDSKEHEEIFKEWLNYERYFGV